MKKRSKRKSSLKVTTARERMEKLDSGGSASYLKLPNDVRFFEPAKGRNTIDILGYQVGAGNPVADEGTLYYERTFYVHRGVGVNGDRVICSAKTFGTKCAVCEERERIRRDGDGDAQAEEQLKEMAPKERQVFNVFDTKHADKGITVWEISAHLFGKKLDEEIDGSEDEDGWELFHTYGEDGKTLRVNMVEDSFGKNTFLRAGSINFVDRQTEHDEAEMLEQVVCLDDILVKPDYEKVKALIDATAPDEEQPKSKRGAKSKKAKVDEEDDDEDECVACSGTGKNSKGRKCVPCDGTGVAEDENEDDDDVPMDYDDEEEEEAPKPKSKKSKKAKPVEEDDDDEEEDDDDDEEEVKPAKAKKAKSKKAPAPVEDDDEDWDDFDEEDDDEEEEEAPKPAPKPAPKAKAKKAPVEDDEDDDDWDDDEEEEEAPKPKASKKKKRR